MKLSANKAYKEAGIAKKTLLEAIENGRLSASRNDKGHWEIDPAELFRVFPKPANENQGEPKPTPLESTHVTTDMAIKIGRLEAELEAEKKAAAMLTDQITKLEEDRDDWKGQAKTLLISNQNQPAATPKVGWFDRMLGRA